MSQRKGCSGRNTALPSPRKSTRPQNRQNWMGIHLVFFFFVYWRIFFFYFYLCVEIEEQVWKIKCKRFVSEIFCVT